MRIRVEFFVAIILAGGVCNPRATLAGGTCSLTHGASYTDSTLLFTYDPANASNMTQVSYYNCSNAAPLFEGRCNNGDVQKGFLNSINGLYMCNGTRWSRYSAPACQPNDGTTFLNTYILGSTTYYQIAISDNAYILYYKQANSGSMRNPCMYTKSTYDALMEQAKKHCTDSGGFVEKPGTLSLINCACMNEGLQKKDRMTCECQDGTVYDRRNKRCIVDQNSLPPPQQTNGGGGSGSGGSNSGGEAPSGSNGGEVPGGSSNASGGSSAGGGGANGGSGGGGAGAGGGAGGGSGNLSCTNLGQTEQAAGKRNTSYHICAIDGCSETRDCHSRDMLTAHATDGHCVSVGRQGYKICTATACDEGYEPYQGYCKKKSPAATPTNKITVTATIKYSPASRVLSGAKIIVDSQVTDTVSDENGKFKLTDIDSNALLGLAFHGCDNDVSYAQASNFANEEYHPLYTVCGDCMESGGMLDDNDECICTDENLQQSDDKKTCVEKSGEPVVSAPADNQNPNQNDCTTSGGTLGEDGKCQCGEGLKPNADETKCEPADEINNTNNTEDPGTNNTNTFNNTNNNDTSQAVKEAEEAYQKAKENEQSLANRTLGAASTAATGLGLMNAAAAYSEQKADDAAEKDMTAYLETFRCEYGKGQTAKAGNEEITLPGGNDLLTYYTEYKQIADALKNTKKALGMRPGIEEEVVYDRAETGLYQYSSVGKTGGAYTSLANALTDTEGEDAAAWQAQKDETSKKLKGGATVAVGGVAGGVLGDTAINTDTISNIIGTFKK